MKFDAIGFIFTAFDDMPALPAVKFHWYNSSQGCSLHEDVSFSTLRFRINVSHTFDAGLVSSRGWHQPFLRIKFFILGRSANYQYSLVARCHYSRRSSRISGYFVLPSLRRHISGERKEMSNDWLAYFTIREIIFTILFSFFWYW
jgi:hypothetical protein